MIVTAGAANRHTERGSTNSLKNFIHSIRSCLSASGWFLSDGCNRNMRTRNEISGSVALTDDVPCDLLRQKIVIRRVFVEGSDDVITVYPSVLAIHVAFRTVGFSPADHVKPVLCPAFTKVWRCKKLFYKSQVGSLCIRLAGLFELIDALGFRWEPREHNRCSPNQCGRCSWPRKAKAVLTKFVNKKSIYRVLLEFIRWEWAHNRMK